MNYIIKIWAGEDYVSVYGPFTSKLEAEVHAALWLAELKTEILESPVVLTDGGTNES